MINHWDFILAVCQFQSSKLCIHLLN